MSAGGQETRVMVVDDHASFRQPLVFMLDREPDLKVIAQASTVAEALETLGAFEKEGEALDLAVVDLNLPDGSGSEFITELQASSMQALALVLSAHSDRFRLARAIEAGAAGVPPQASRLREILGGRRPAPPRGA